MLPFCFNNIDKNNISKIEYIYNNYHNLMLFFANEFPSNLYTAEDVVQEAFIKIIKYINKIDINEENKTKAFIRIVIKSVVMDMNRKNIPRTLEETETIFEIKDNEISPLEQIINKEEYDKIIDCISRLSDTYKDVCILKYVNDLSEKEIAKILNLPLKTVNVRIFRGKQMLKQMIAESRERD